jgi:imidazolonepropionase-like amidohydrolase
MEGHEQYLLIRADKILSPAQQGERLHSVLIKDGFIEDILSGNAVPDNVKTFNFPGHVIAPCFCDYHLHFSASARGSVPQTADKLLAHGIRKTYEGGDTTGAGLKAKKDLHGKLEVVSAGQGLYKAGRYGKYIGQCIKNIEHARSVIEALISAGVDYIKIVHSGIYDPETDRITAGGFERSELGEMIAFARDEGLPVFCHANGARATREAVEAGASAIIHGLYVSDETLSEMAEKNIVCIPTLQAFRSIGRLPGSAAAKNNLERPVDGHLAAVSRAHAKGVKVLPGSDAGPQFIPYGTSFIEELMVITNTKWCKF